jgi:uncharacterized protein DUF6220
MPSRGMRIVFAVVAWLFVGAVLYQVFLAGVGLFVPGVDQFSAHRQFGWMLHGAPLLVLLFGWIAHPGRRTMWLIGALFVLVAFQPFLPTMREDSPWVAALHPVNAVLIFWLGMTIALRATALSREPIPAETAPEATEGVVAERT